MLTGKKVVFWNIPESTVFSVYKYMYDSVPGCLVVSRGVGLSGGEVGVGDKCW